jgi:redox-sensitive bicupin YhaK (pirin superfamily)
MTAPGYQSMTAADIPTVDLPQDAGRARVIAGRFWDTKGPAHTFTPVNLWDFRLNRDADLTIDLPEGHMAALGVVPRRKERITFGISLTARHTPET